MTSSSSEAPAPVTAPLGLGLPKLDADLLRRYDTAGPRYTSYPSARELKSDFGEAQYRHHALLSQSQAAAPLSLYVHIPFCASPCFYCGCNRIITRDATAGGHYVSYLLREAGLIAPLYDPGREVQQLHLGGGTPNFLHPDELSRLVQGIANHFPLSRQPDRDFSVELDPRFLAEDFIPTLARLGFNRASLGVQDIDPDVQRAVNRMQSVEQTLAALAQCREQGLRSVNVDLLYGLPRQTVEGFRRTLETVIEARPDRLAIYGYAHMPHLFKAQRQIHPGELPDAEKRLALLREAVEALGAAGYRYIGLDHFALPTDDLALAQERGGLHRNFMGYTTHADCDLIGLCVSAISHVEGSFSQNHRDLKAWEAALAGRRLPIWRGLALTFDDIVRGDVIQQIMCQGAVDIRAVESRHGIRFPDYFGEALGKLQPLEDDGLVTANGRQIGATARGRALLRLIAMCFDRYAGAPSSASQQVPFSRVI